MHILASKMHIFNKKLIYFVKTRELLRRKVSSALFVILRSHPFEAQSPSRTYGAGKCSQLRLQQAYGAEASTGFDGKTNSGTVARVEYT